MRATDLLDRPRPSAAAVTVPTDVGGRV